MQRVIEALRRPSYPAVWHELVTGFPKSLFERQRSIYEVPELRGKERRMLASVASRLRVLMPDWDELRCLAQVRNHIVLTEKQATLARKVFGGGDFRELDEGLVMGRDQVEWHIWRTYEGYKIHPAQQREMIKLELIFHWDAREGNVAAVIVSETEKNDDLIAGRPPIYGFSLTVKQQQPGFEVNVHAAGFSGNYDFDRSGRALVIGW